MSALGPAAVAIAAERLGRVARGVARAPIRPLSGRVVSLHGPLLRAAMAGARQGGLCEIHGRGGAPLPAEVVGFDGPHALLCPFGDTAGLGAGAEVRPVDAALRLPVGRGLLGRVVDAFAAPLDGRGPIAGPLRRMPARGGAPAALERPLIDTPLPTGVRAIDGPLTLGRGQRMALLGPPGAGKSSLLAAIARGAEADAVVIGLVGERGREVREFLDRDLPREARGRTACFVSTSDRPAVERALCVQAATAAAEALRDEGLSVLLLIDSLTRTARALREIGLAAGEAPGRRGYPASVGAALSALMERAGRAQAGEITAVYSVLTEGDGEDDPIAEEVRSLSDGHVVLSADLAEAGHFPAIDVPRSLSRVMRAVTSDAHGGSAARLRARLAKWREIEMLVQIGEYEAGRDREADRAIEAHPRIMAFLRQGAERGGPLAAMPGLMRAAS